MAPSTRSRCAIPFIASPCRSSHLQRGGVRPDLCDPAQPRRRTGEHFHKVKKELEIRGISPVLIQRRRSRRFTFGLTCRRGEHPSDREACAMRGLFCIRASHHGFLATDLEFLDPGTFRGGADGECHDMRGLRHNMLRKMARKLPLLVPNYGSARQGVWSDG